MYNLKGYNIVFGPGPLDVEEHFCRVEGDCDSVGRTWGGACEEAAEHVGEVAQAVADIWRQGIAQPPRVI